MVGPAAISGQGGVDAELVSAALDCIDDRLGLLGATVVPAERIWRDVMSSVIGDASTATVVCPRWWLPSRVDRVRAAAQTTAARVVVQ
ncbi:MAG: type VII secretion-associated protein, partial [Mycobacterium sp.]|nr:type VII secretion-associated protein [Mycobacterium sp.]